jgi:phosphoribosylformylglycinamidine cyclo-ligase
MNELQHDEKGLASLTLGDVIRQTAHNYPDSRFHPKIFAQTTHYTIAGIDPSPFSFWATADGIGTKPELAERLYAESLKGIPKPAFFESLAFDTLAMVDGDDARFGRYMVGAAEILDTNTADPKVINALARGLKAACDDGQFALLNGETAELGYRTSGYGDVRVNWNAVGISVFNPEKLLLGNELRAGQPIVAFRERSIRSNGLSLARKVLEASFLAQNGFKSKEDYLMMKLSEKGIDTNNDIGKVLTEIFGHDMMEQMLLPWHTAHPTVTEELLMPSRLYGPMMYAAQGKIDEPRTIGLTGAGHISGGGIPEKARRMVETKGLGVSLESVFPDPDSVTHLMEIAAELPEEVQAQLKLTERKASETWNRGIGFVMVTENMTEAENLVLLAQDKNYEAAIAGEVIDHPEIHWRGQVWNYRT